MSNQFIIVIEVDNVRAAAAYQKGLEDLNIVWPQLMVYADKQDTAKQIEYNAKLLKHEQKQKVYQDSWDNYYTAVKEWEEKTIFRGSRPESPDYYFPIMPPYPPPSVTGYYRSIKIELQDKANLANAATSPYRMTENQVKEMIAWENGERIEEIMQGIKGK